MGHQDLTARRPGHAQQILTPLDKSPVLIPPDQPFRPSPIVTSCPLWSSPLVYNSAIFYLYSTVHSTMDDKDTLPHSSSEEASLPRWAAERSKTSKKWRPLLAMAALSFLALYTLNPTPLAEPAHGIQCPYQPEPLHPKIAWEMDDKEKIRSADLLSQAVVCAPCRVRLMG